MGMNRKSVLHFRLLLAVSCRLLHILSGCAGRLGLREVTRAESAVEQRTG